MCFLWWHQLWSTYHPCWYTYFTLWMQPGSLKLVLSKGHLHTGSRYCISTLSTANVVAVLSQMNPSVLFRILDTSNMCTIWYCALSRFVWLFWSVCCCCFVECRCFVFALKSAWKICFLLFTSSLVWCRCWTRKIYWLFQHNFLMRIQRDCLRSIKTAICTYRFCIVSVSTLAVFLPQQS